MKDRWNLRSYLFYPYICFNNVVIATGLYILRMKDMITWTVNYFPVVAITNSHKVIGLKEHILILPQP